jgi:hypothetical protein
MNLRLLRLNSHRIAVAILAVAAVTANAQLNISSRLSNQRYGYVFGGGPDSHTDDVLITRTAVLPTDVMNTTFADSTSGTWFEHSWTAGVSVGIHQQYELIGPAANANKIRASAGTMVSAFAGGDIGVAGCSSNNPGNELTFYFTANQAIRYRMKGQISIGNVGSIIYVQYFDGFTWQYLFSTWTLVGLMGPFNSTVMLSPGTQYRITGEMGFGANANESWSHTFNYAFEPAGQVSGHVSLSDFNGPVANEKIDVEVRNGGSVVDTIEDVPLDASGNYSCYTSALGTNDIVVKGRTWLAQQVSGVNFTLAGVSNINFTLTNGDIDGDNEVSIGDYAQLSAAYNSSPGDGNWNVNADLNGDESVDIGDYAILSQNYGLSGD